MNTIWQIQYAYMRAENPTQILYELTQYKFMSLQIYQSPAKRGFFRSQIARICLQISNCTYAKAIMGFCWLLFKFKIVKVNCFSEKTNSSIVCVCVYELYREVFAHACTAHTCNLYSISEKRIVWWTLN